MSADPREVALRIADELHLGAEDRAQLLAAAGGGPLGISKAASEAFRASQAPGGTLTGSWTGAIVALDEALRESAALEALPDDAARAAYLASQPPRGGARGASGIDDDEEAGEAVSRTSIEASAAWLARQDALRAAERKFAAARGDVARAAAWTELEALRRAAPAR